MVSSKLINSALLLQKWSCEKVSKW